MAAFYLDEDVAGRLAQLLIERGHTVATTEQERRKGAPDARQLLYAAERGWVLLTNNGDHYRLLHDAWLTWAHAWNTRQAHCGIVILPHTVPSGLAAVATAVHQLVSDPGTTLDTALYTWSSATGWRRWPR